MRFLLAVLLLLFVLPAQAQQGQGMSQAVVVSSCGGGALPSGAVNQLTMNPQGQLCLVGIGGGSGCTAATNYLARTVGGNEGGNATNITTLICGLVTDGVITGNLSGARGCGSHLDALYILAQQNQVDSFFNLCGTSYSIINSARRIAVSPFSFLTFTAYQGWSGFNGNNTWYLDTNFNPSTATTPNFIQNSASFSVWSYTVINGAAAQIGNANGDAGASNIFNSATATFYGRLNGAAGINEATTATKGLFAAERTAVSTMALYQNGATSGPHASDTSGAPDSADFILGNAAPGLAFATAQTLSAAHIGGSLGATLELALYNRLRTYMTAVGAP